MNKKSQTPEISAPGRFVGILCVIVAAAFVAACSEKPDDPSAPSQRPLTAKVSFEQKWIVQGAIGLGHESHHGDPDLLHMDTDSYFSLSEDGNNFKIPGNPGTGTPIYSGLKPVNRNGSPWEQVEFRATSHKELANLKPVGCDNDPAECLTPTAANEFCEIGCLIGELKTKYHGQDDSGPEQFHVVVLDLVDPTNENAENACDSDPNSKKDCLQIEIFCLDKDCTMALPEAGVLQDDEFADAFHRGSGHAHSDQ